MSAVDGLPGQSAARKVVFLAALMIAASLILSGFAAPKVFDAAIEAEIQKRANLIGKPVDRVFIALNEQASGVFRHIIKPEAAGTLMRIARRLSDRAYDLAERGGTSGKLASIHKAYVSDVRFPLFLYSTATEISGSFLLIHARDSSSLSWLSDDMAATAPLIACLAAIAMVSPFSVHIASRIGGRNLFLLSIPVTALALIGIGLGHSVVSISLWHGAMALVYALATVACQEYSLGPRPRAKTRRFWGYLFIILGGAFCGASLGGVLADRFGIPGTFFFSAGLALASGLLGHFALSAKADRHSVLDGAPARVEPLASGNILFTPRFLSLLTGVTLPINVKTSVFIWFITPLALETKGAGFADIGRVMKVYYLVPLLVGPAFARMADGRIGYAPFLVADLSVSGIALTPLFLWSGFWPVAVAVGVFGLGRSMCDSSHYAQAIHIAETSGLRNARLTGPAGLRIIKRLAAIAGLVVAAVFLERVGYVSIGVLIGLIMFAGAVVVATVELGSGPRQR
jgi:MFS family permease